MKTTEPILMRLKLWSDPELHFIASGTVEGGGPIASLQEKTLILGFATPNKATVHTPAPGGIRLLASAFNNYVS